MNGTADKGEHIRRVAIVGAGQSSLLLGCDLLRYGYDVKVYSARTAEEVLAQPAAAAPFLFGRTLEYERELGLGALSGSDFAGSRCVVAWPAEGRPGLWSDLFQRHHQRVAGP